MALIFDEQFEATGYDETAAGIGSDWTETNAGGGTLDEDFAVSDVETATGLSLPTWGDQCVKLAGGTSEVSIRQVLDSGQTDFYLRFDLILGNVADLPNSTLMNLVYATDGAVSGFIMNCYRDSSGNIKLYGIIKNSGGDINLPASPYYVAAINTKYRIDLHFIGDGTCELKINGASQGTGATTTNSFNRVWFYKGLATYQNNIIYFDNVQMATDGWVPDDGGVSAALTGTAMASITEADIVAGGKMIIITLTGDTFISA